MPNMSILLAKRAYECVYAQRNYGRCIEHTLCRCRSNGKFFDFVAKQWTEEWKLSNVFISDHTQHVGYSRALSPVIHYTLMFLEHIFYFSNTLRTHTHTHARKHTNTIRLATLYTVQCCSVNGMPSQMR